MLSSSGRWPEAGPATAVLLLACACAFLLGGCGRAADREEGRQGRSADSEVTDAVALEALQSLRRITLSDECVALFAQAVWKLEERDDCGPRVVDAAQALLDCDHADVILVGDYHSSGICRTAFARCVQMLQARLSPARHSAVFLEAIPASRQADLDAARAVGRESELLALLQAEWPFSVTEFAAFFRTLDAARMDVRAAGIERDPSKRWNPPPTTPDHLRCPGLPPLPPRGAPVEDLSSARRAELAVREITRFYQANALVRDLVVAWRQAQSGACGQAYVLYGAAHLAGYDDSLRSHFRAVGLRVVVLVPVMLPLELAIREYIGAAAGHQWVEVAQGVYRPPVVSNGEWVTNIRNLEELVERGRQETEVRLAAQERRRNPAPEVDDE